MKTRIQIGIAVVVIALAVTGAWLYATAGRASTDAAQVDAHVTPIAARVGGTVLGVVLNNVDLKHDQKFYYYTNYYGYYQTRDKESRRGRSQGAVTPAHNGSSEPDDY